MMEPFVRMEEGAVQIYKSKFGMESPRLCVFVRAYSRILTLTLDRVIVVVLDVNAHPIGRVRIANISRAPFINNPLRRVTR